MISLAARSRLAWAAVAVASSLLQPLTASPARAVDGGDVRLMPLGDSITHGADVPGGYRTRLEGLLSGGDRSVDFVGSQSGGPVSLADRNHEGHGGWRIDQVDAAITTWLTTSRPQTVLLHIGTNDVGQNFDLPGAPGRLAALIDKITAAAPTADVFVATLITMAWADPAAKIAAYNERIPAIVQSKVDVGKRVHLVDMASALSADDLSDGVHPTQQGYDKMAEVWYAALRAVPGSLIGDRQPSRLVNPQSGRCLDVAGVSHAPGTTTQLFDCWTGTNQSWTVTSAGELRVYGDRCLEAAAAGSGAAAHIAACTGDPRQRWVLREDSTILNVGLGRCLNVDRGQNGNGARVQVWDCNGTGAQRWRRA